MIVDNGINEIYVRALIRLGYDGSLPTGRLLICGGADGARTLRDGQEYWFRRHLRSAFFIDHSTIHAF